MSRVPLVTALLTLLLLAGCYNFNNPVDPAAANYQGFASEPPPVPTSVPAAPGVLTLWAYAPDREHGLRITWPDYSDNEDGFRIERRVAAGVFASLATVAVDVTEYLDLSLSPDTTYEFRVCAFNALGDSAYGTGPSWDMAPASVTGLTGVPYLANRIKLDWTDVSTTNDWYLIERSTDGVVFVEHVAEGALGGDLQTWQDTALPASTDYWYRIYAYRSSDFEKSGPVEIGPITSP